MPLLGSHEESKKIKSENISSSSIGLKKPERLSKYERSLELLTKRFMQLIHDAKNNCLDLNDISATLNVHKRRVYDVIHVLEGINVVKRSKRHVSMIQSDESWSYKVESLKKELATLKQEEIQLDKLTNKLILLNDYRADKRYQWRTMSKYMHVTKDDILQASNWNKQTVMGITAQNETKMELYMNEKEDRHNLYFNSSVAQSKPLSYHVLKSSDNAKCDDFDEEVSSLSMQQEPRDVVHMESAYDLLTAPLLYPSRAKASSSSSQSTQVSCTPTFRFNDTLKQNVQLLSAFQDQSSMANTPTIFSNELHPTLQSFPKSGNNPRSQYVNCHVPIVSPETIPPNDYGPVDELYSIPSNPQDLFHHIEDQEYFMLKEEFQYDNEKDRSVEKNMHENNNLLDFIPSNRESKT